MAMASPTTKLLAGDLASSSLNRNFLFSSSSSSSRVSFAAPKHQRRLHVLALAVKRSPKRLKYSAPRFTKEDELLYVEVDPSGDDSWKLEPVVDLLKQGAVGVIPTDTVYAIVCDPRNHSAVDRLQRIKKIEPTKPLTILCHTFHDIDWFTIGFPRGDSKGHANIFRQVKQCLPGPYTFILTATKELPKQCIMFGTPTAKLKSRKDVGVRMPDDAICQAILEKMDSPLISTSCKCAKENEWILDPVAIADTYGPEGLDFVIDGGLRLADPSTVVDMTVFPPKIIRQGNGPQLHWMVTEGDHDDDIYQEELACDEAELGPDEFAERMQIQEKLHEQQLEMLKHMRKFPLDDQSAILEKLRQHMEIGKFEDAAPVLSSEQIQEIVRRRVSPLFNPSR